MGEEHEGAKAKKSTKKGAVTMTTPSGCFTQLFSL
jgi:hypothetical protein